MPTVSDLRITPVTGELNVSTQIVPPTGTVAANPTPLLAGNNLADLPNPVAARDNLGLGIAATMNVGTIAGTVAAGDLALLKTGGTMTGPLTAPLSTSTILALDGTTSKTLAAWAGEVINVKDFGAMGDGVTDDTVAINAALTYIRTHLNVPHGKSWNLVFPMGEYLAKSTLNFTGLKNGVIFGNGAILFGKIINAPVIDALGTSKLRISDLTIIGDSVSTPSIGVQIGRYASEVAADQHIFENVQVSGSFVFTSFYNSAAESCSFFSCSFSNENLGVNSFAVVQDGLNHWIASSFYTTVSLLHDNTENFRENLFVNCSFQGAGNNGVVWLANTERHKFLRCSALCTTGWIFSIYGHSTGGPTHSFLDIDCRCQNAGLEHAVVFTGPAAQPFVNGFSFEDSACQAQNSVFARDVTVGTVDLRNADIRVSPGIGVTPSLFDTPSQWFVRAKHAFIPSTMWSGTPGSWSGPVDYTDTPGIVTVPESFRIVPLSGASITIPTNVEWFNITPVTSLPSYTVTLPASPIHGQNLCISTTETITNFSLRPNTGQSLSTSPTALAANSSISYRFDAIGNNWVFLSQSGTSSGGGSSGGGAQNVYAIPNSSGWMQLGAFSSTHQGDHVLIKIVDSHDAQSNPNGNQIAYVLFKTSTGPTDGNGFAGDGIYYQLGPNTDAPGNIKWVANAAGQAATTFTLFINQAGLPGSAFYTVETFSGVWTHIGLSGQSDPGSASATVCVPQNKFYVGSDAQFLSSVTVSGTLTVGGSISLSSASLSSLSVSGATALNGGATSTTPTVNDNSTKVATTAWVLGQAATVLPTKDGTATIGSSLNWARADHIHPTDTSRAATASPAFTGTATAVNLTVSGTATFNSTVTGTGFSTAAAAAAPIQTVAGRTGAITLAVADVSGALNKAGDTMTGALTLSGAPSSSLHAATKAYVDAGDALALPKAGGTMTGTLILSGAPVNSLDAATKAYVDSVAATGVVIPTASLIGGNGSAFTSVTVGSGLGFSGSTLSANVTTVAGRTGAVTLAVADVSGALNKAGDTMTGALTLSGAPVNSLHAATKAYVDAATGITIPNASIVGGDGSVLTSVTVGTGLAFGSNTLSVSAATTGALGGVKVGSGLSVSSGTISVTNPYVAANVLQVSNNLSDVASANIARNNIDRGTTALTDATSIATNAATGNVFIVTIAGSRTLANPTNLQAGARYTWIVHQDASGGRTLSFGSLFKFANGAVPTLSTSANAIDVLSAVYDGTSLLCVMSNGFA